MTIAIAPRKPQRPLFWSDAILDLLDALSGIEEAVYIVGGAVRDAYLQRPMHDIDLTTPRNAIKLGRKIAKLLNGDFYILDRERDVARILLDVPDIGDEQLVIDIARFRGDGLLADLTDRDFTINAMAVELKDDFTHLIDPLNGEQDLIDKVIRRCQPLSIFDDPIRAIRAVRQSVQFNARIEPQTLTDIRSAASSLPETSPERVRDELFKLLSVPRPSLALRVADKLGLLEIIIPEIKLLHVLTELPRVVDIWQHTLTVIEKLDDILIAISPKRNDNTAAVFYLGAIVVGLDRFRPQLQKHIINSWANNRPHRALLMLSALLRDVGQSVDDTTEKRAVSLRLSNDEKNRLSTIVCYHNLPLTVELTDLEMHRFWRKLGAAGVDVCLLALADHLGTVGTEIDQDEWVAIIERIQTLLDAYYVRYAEVVSPPSLVNGNQLMEELAIEPGKHIGLLLDAIREGQVTKEINTVEEALAAARKHLKTLQN